MKEDKKGRDKVGKTYHVRSKSHEKMPKRFEKSTPCLNHLPRKQLPKSDPCQHPENQQLNFQKF